ncbi:DUF5722 domain-containing protein [Paenibacillus sp. PL91]|uniref:DUF5722 domain-containing protein n=1 Tax=Paenibacillus sp. PL91 TaxID=2729538 RepID=UPI00145E5AA2|nr:DUF5722 domain-containing protein [Paenibacillus sp. PL91]MBC9202182.1 hypothetical protein [Paenibacillus sp. PL91]
MSRLRGISTMVVLVMLLQLIFAAAVSAGAYDPGLQESEHVTSGQDIFPALIINDFNTQEDASAWKAGVNTKEVTFVTSILNGPNGPYEGGGALEQIPNQVKVYDWRTIYREFDQPLDLSSYRFLAFAANSWGWQSAADYVLKINLYSGNDVFESVAMIRPDSWKRVFIKLDEWAGRNAVTKMEVSFIQNYDLADVSPGQPGYDYWDGHFQIDYISATNAIDFSFNEKGETEGFTAPTGTVEVIDDELTYAWDGQGLLESPAIMIDTAKRNGMSVTMTNGTGASELVVQWRSDGGHWSDDNMKSFTIPTEGKFTQDLNFSDHTGWNGMVTAFRIIPQAASGILKVDQIRFKQLAQLEKPYDGKAQARIESGGLVIDGTLNQAFVEAHPSEQLYLIELATYEDAKSTLAAKSPTAQTNLGQSFRFEIGLTDGERSRLYSKFVVAARTVEGEYIAIDAPQYVINAEVMASNTEPFPQAQSIKGLQVQMTGDAQELGISHAALNVPYNELMYKANSHPDNTIAYEVEGETFYFRKDKIERMDNEIKSLSDNNTLVSLILIMYDTRDPESANEYLIHPDSEQGGIVYALNTANEAGVKYVKAATKFLAERYSMANEQYGRAVNYIVGNEVGQNKVWNNMGPKPVDAYAREYAQTLRLIDTIVKSEYANARTYVSLDHFWNENLEGDSMWKYDNKVIVDRLTQLIGAEGNFAWNVAFHPYPEDLFNPRFWNDATATDSFDTKRITFKNLEVLVDYMKQPAYLFDGAMRRIILSEQGFHSLSNSVADQEIQAASYAYAYYKVKFLDGIDAFILHRHVDHGQEGGLNLGLWTHTPNSVTVPDQHKVIYDVFKYIDTSRSLEETAFAKAIIGIDDWTDVIPNFDPSKLNDRTEPVLNGLDFIRKTEDSTNDGGFESSTEGYEESDEVSSVERITGDAFRGIGFLKASINSPYGINWAGVQKTYERPINVKKTPYFTAALKLPNANSDKDYYAKFIVYSGTKSVEGIAKLDPSADWQQLALPLGNWKGATAVDRIKIWVQTEGGDPWKGELYIDEAAFAKKVTENKDYVNLEVTANQLSKRLEVGSEIAVTITNNSSGKLNKKIKVESSKSVQFSPSSISLEGLSTGQSKIVTLKVTKYEPEEGIVPKITLEYEARGFQFTLQDKVPVEEPTGSLYSFEDGVQGWSAGENVAGVAAVRSFANGPTVPIDGMFALAANSQAAPADAWKTLTATPSTPFDLTDTPVFYYHINSYGGVPNASYETRVVLKSGTEAFTYTAAMSPDQWNKISVDTSEWAHHHSITGIELSFRAIGNAMAWAPQFQIDNIGSQQ